MKYSAMRMILPMVVLCMGFVVIAGEAEVIETNASGDSLVIAEVHHGELIPMLSDGEIKDYLEDAFLAADDPELHIFLEKVWFEKHGENHYLMAVAADKEGKKLSSAIKLDEVPITANASAVGIPIPIAIIPFCKSITCTNNPCPMKVWEDHIECYCIAAGDCELKWRILTIGRTTRAGL